MVPMPQKKPRVGSLQSTTEHRATRQRRGLWPCATRLLLRSGHAGQFNFLEVKADKARSG
eukprot:6188318-Pleurochrysis_carterae.AAC.1